MSLYSSNYFEIGLKPKWFALGKNTTSLYDPENDINYIFGTLSLEYCIMLVDEILESEDSERLILELRRNYGMRFNASSFARFSGQQHELSEELPRLFRIVTLQIKTSEKTKLQRFHQYAYSFEYTYMYKTRHSLAEVADIENLIESSSGGLARATNMDEPPKRNINEELLDFYVMALEANDPFTKYISFYHIIEYYFDAVYRKHLISEMRDKLTSPDFSYKSDDKIYDLARYVKKQMQIDDERGNGNEFDSLKYVLTEYVPVEELKKGILELNSTLVDYYENKPVQFAKNGNKTKVSWNDMIGVYTTISTRIYETRNALVHSKSEQREKLYKPQKHKGILEREIPLVQVIAELIIFHTGSVINMEDTY